TPGKTGTRTVRLGQMRRRTYRSPRACQAHRQAPGAGRGQTSRRLPLGDLGTVAHPATTVPHLATVTPPHTVPLTAARPTVARRRGAAGATGGFGASRGGADGVSPCTSASWCSC